jgi:hypothetical protein
LTPLIVSPKSVYTCLISQTLDYAASSLCNISSHASPSCITTSFAGFLNPQISQITRITLQAISKMQITFKDKARADEKAQHTRGVCEHFEEARNTVIGR